MDSRSISKLNVTTVASCPAVCHADCCHCVFVLIFSFLSDGLHLFHLDILNWKTQFFFLFFADCGRTLFPPIWRDSQLGGRQPPRPCRRRTRFGGSLPPGTRRFQYRERHRRTPSGLWRRSRHGFLAHPTEPRRTFGRASRDPGRSDVSVEVEGSVADPPKGFGHRRSCLARPTLFRRTSQRLLGHLGGGRRRPQGPSLHGRHIGDSLFVARHRLPHPSRFGDCHIGCHPDAFRPVDHRHPQSARRPVGRVEAVAGRAVDRPPAFFFIRKQQQRQWIRSSFGGHSRRRRRCRRFSLPFGVGDGHRNPPPQAGQHASDQLSVVVASPPSPPPIHREPVGRQDDRRRPCPLPDAASLRSPLPGALFVPIERTPAPAGRSSLRIPIVASPLLAILSWYK